MAKTKGRALGLAIQAYLVKHRISQQAFAEQVGVTQGLVSQWIKGKSQPKVARAKALIRATKGEVSAEVIYPEIFMLKRQ